MKKLITIIGIGFVLLISACSDQNFKPECEEEKKTATSSLMK